MSSFRIELPEVFSGEDGQDFRQWVRRFEVAVNSVPDTTIKKEHLLPSRLSSSAFTVWESLPTSDRKDFGKAREALTAVFGRNTYLKTFQSCITARTRQPMEPLEVFAAAIATLVAEAFPTYDEASKDGEKFRRFVAGVDARLRTKIYELGAETFQDAVAMAVRIEQAGTLVQSASGSSSPAVAATKDMDPYSEVMKRLDALEEKLDKVHLHSAASHPPSQRSPSPRTSSQQLTDDRQSERYAQRRYRSPSPRQYSLPQHRQFRRSPSPQQQQYRPSRRDSYDDARSVSPRRHYDNQRSARPSSFDRRDSPFRQMSYDTPRNVRFDRSTSPYGRRYESSPPRFKQPDNQRSARPSSFDRRDSPFRQMSYDTQRKVHFDDQGNYR